MPTSVKKYSAIDLLDKVFEFIEMTPNPNEWNLQALKSNPPRQIRFRQIDALFNAFFIEESNRDLLSKAMSKFSKQRKISIESFLNGNFLKTRTIDSYSNLVEFIKDFLETGTENIDQSKEIRIEHLVFIFPKLIDFKKHIRNLLTFNSGWLEANTITSLFSIQLTNSISNNLIGRYNELDTVIGLFIDPKSLTFTEEELITRFSFPTENLNAIDADFI